ncbi:MAG: aspartate-semialdehyde dehydrogenase [Candidatus Micrarchaeota archaeon]
MKNDAGKIDVAVLGATGAVGQKFLQLLENHPMFNVAEICASENSAGKTIGEATKWVVSSEIPQYLKNMKIKNVDSEIKSQICFSALPPEVAETVEVKLAKQGKIVISKAKTNRYEADVPILIPEVNPESLDQLIPKQKANRKLKGCIITDPNCTTTGLALTLKPLVALGLKEVQMVSMQAISGAGYPGVPSLLITENVIPFIGGEEEKVVKETKKILGLPNLEVFATCNRVQVIDGHTESVHVRFDRTVSVDEVKNAMRNFKGIPQKLKLPSAPDPVIIVRDEDDRPQPRLDRDNGKGMAVTVGRIRQGIDEKSIAYTLVSHNTVRGAAGASILDAEYLVKTNKLAELLR